MYYYNNTVVNEKKETILTIDTRGSGNRKHSMIDSDNEDLDDQGFEDTLGIAIQRRSGNLWD